MIRIEKLSFAIGDFELRCLDLEVADGEYFALLGPPGSGKSIFLECLCGLKQVGSGRIYIDGRDVSKVEPRRRNIGYVPQDYALFPHLRVKDNIAFGLRSQGCGADVISSRVTETGEMLGIGHLLDRNIGGLSGGERQAVALARALVLQPKLLLLDEPVSALDESTRQQVCAQLRGIQRQLGLTTIHVSHNLEEAFSVADRAGILNDGVLQQTGLIGQLLRQPANEFVGRFMRCNNFLSGEVVGPGTEPETTILRCGQAQLQVPGQHQGHIKFIIRSENVLLIKPDQSGQRQGNKVSVRLIGWRDCGNYVRIELEGCFGLVAHLSHAAFADLKIEQECELVAVLEPEAIHVLPE